MSKKRKRERDRAREAEEQEMQEAYEQMSAKGFENLPRMEPDDSDDEVDEEDVIRACREHTRKAEEQEMQEVYEQMSAKGFENLPRMEPDELGDEVDTEGSVHISMPLATEEIIRSMQNESKEKMHHNPQTEAQALGNDAKAAAEKTKKMAEEQLKAVNEDTFNVYTEAKKILDQENLRRLFSDDNTDTLWQYVNGYYNPLCRPELESMAYENLPEKIKMKKDKVRPLLNGIVDYMLLESSRKDAKAECFTQGDLEMVRNHIVFKNGVYDVVTGEFGPHTDQYPYYVGVDACFLEDNYEESIAYSMLKSNATEGDKESMDMIDCVTAALFLNTKHKNIFAAGSASNSGKSKYFEFIEHLLPEKRISRLEPSRLDGRFALGGSDAVVLFCCADIEMDYVSRKAASSLKMITGDTFIRTEAKYQNAKETRIMGNVLLGTNGRLRTKVRDPGFAERLRVLPFIRSVPKEKRDEQLLIKLLEDRDEIMTECAQRLHENVMNGQMRIPESELSAKMKQEWLYPCDLFDEFLENKIVITGDRSDILDRTTIYQYYADYYAIHCGEVESGDVEILKKREFFDKLKEASQGKVFDRRVKPADKSKKNYVHRLCGIGLRTETV
ncbi:MAG: DUF5906 domain-containing protein [Lachnospiraceae bacterium]|nr:DUF5906 domain-containing protein [Lachnospiraceae bacterium]